MKVHVRECMMLARKHYIEGQFSISAQHYNLIKIVNGM